MDVPLSGTLSTYALNSCDITLNLLRDFHPSEPTYCVTYVRIKGHETRGSLQVALKRWNTIVMSQSFLFFIANFVYDQAEKSWNKRQATIVCVM